MLFGKKEKAFPVKIKELPQNLYAVGVATVTDDKAIFKDARKLSARFQKQRSKIQHRRDPWAFIVYSGTKDENGKLYYFVGDVVEKTANKGDLDSIIIPAGTYAKITVEKKKFTGWTTQVAKARKYFHCEWIKNSEYKLLDTFQDMDYYDNRSRVSPPSMDIYFPIQKI